MRNLSSDDLDHLASVARMLFDLSHDAQSMYGRACAGIVLSCWCERVDDIYHSEIMRIRSGIAPATPHGNTISIVGRTSPRRPLSTIFSVSKTPGPGRRRPRHVEEWLDWSRALPDEEEDAPPRFARRIDLDVQSVAPVWSVNEDVAPVSV